MIHLAGYRNYSARARAMAMGLDLAAAPFFGVPPRPPRAETDGAGSTLDRILLIRPDHAGDLLMATPAIRALRKAHPGAQIELLASPWGAPAVQGNPDIDRVRTIEATWFEPRKGTGPDPARLIGDLVSLRLCSPACVSRYDAAADLRGDFRSILMAFWSGAGRRAGFSRIGLEALLTDSIPLEPAMDHVTRNHRVVQLLGAGPLESRRPVFVVSPAADAAAARLLAPLPVGGLIVAIFPGTNRPWASWGTERFTETARLVQASGGASIVVGGAAGDRLTAEHVTGGCGARAPGALNLAGATSLAEAAGVIKRASVLITNDSGAAHLAVAVGTPVVAIYGPADPALSWTWDDPARHVALYGPSTCARPCFRTNCPGDHGYASITPEDVASIALRLAGSRVGENRP